MADSSKYLHILAFECPHCQTPVLEWTFSQMRNLESADASSFHPKCSCGWADHWLGAQARGHAVLPWSGPEGSSEEDVDEEVAFEPDTGNPV
jgi:hypothetical protein